MSTTSHTLDCQCAACRPLMEQEEARRGQLVADVLNVCRHASERDRYAAEWGSKTALGIFRTVKRIIEEGK